jgi:magnesium-transporting ATPase (P-type)
MAMNRDAASGRLIGLSSTEAERLRREIGPNEIAREQSKPPWVLLLAQFNSPVIWLLLAACIVSAALGELADAVAIGAIVIVNALVGFFQEYRAERAVFALRAMTAPRAHVIRNGRSEIISASDVVPGDILMLEAGDIVAADARLLEAHVLSTMEAALTGESVPVTKRAEASRSDAPLAERYDSVFLGTSVATGTGFAEVTATGMRTELGRIAHLLTTANEEATPLQTRLAVLSRLLMFLCLGIVAMVARMATRVARHGNIDVRGIARSRGRPGRIAGNRDDRSCRRNAAHGGPACLASPPDGRGNAGMRQRHLYGQNRNAHDWHHGCARSVGTRSCSRSRSRCCVFRCGSRCR